jgi:hypothetical protein
MTTLKRLCSIVVMVLWVAVSPLAGAQGTAQKPASATLKGDAAHPAHAVRWVDTRLYFGLGPADAPDKGVNEAAWREFLDKEVTPRFQAIRAAWKQKTGDQSVMKVTQPADVSF